MSLSVLRGRSIDWRWPWAEQWSIAAGDTIQIEAMMKSISKYVDRSIQHPIAQPAPVVPMAPVIEGQWRKRKALQFKMNGFAWLVIFAWLVFIGVFTSVIASQAWEYAVVFAGAFAAGCMVTTFGAVIVVWLATHKQ